MSTNRIAHSLSLVVTACIALSTLTFSQTAAAAPEELRYKLEIEPHLTFGAGNVYGRTGFGLGVRFGIPLATGHLGELPDNIAINFGGDFVHYESCYYDGRCRANYLMIPVAAQFNLFVARSVSLFGEAGVFVYKGFFDGCSSIDGPRCNAPSDVGLLPTLAIGGRIHIDRNLAVTARLGYPTVTLGLSFM